MDTLSEGSASSSKSATIEMYVGSSYNETLSGETLSSMSEKSDSYFTTELDSRHRPGGGSRYLTEHSPVYGPADFQDEPDDEHRPLPSSHAFPPSWGHCTLPRPQPGQHVGRQQRQHHGLSRQHSTSNLGARQREGRAPGCHYYSPPSGEQPPPPSSHPPASGEPSGYSKTSRGPSASSRGWAGYSPTSKPLEPHPVLPHIYSNQLPQAYPDLPPPPPLLSPPSPYYSPPNLERAPKFGDV